ncbi:MAG: hypothetical protein R3D78_06525 [Paracoccaceae bacterium]
MAFELAQGGASAMIVGDAIGNAHLAFAVHRLGLGLGSGYRDGGDDAAVALVAAGRAADADGRLSPAEGGIGRVEAVDGAYRFVAGCKR